MAILFRCRQGKIKEDLPFRSRFIRFIDMDFSLPWVSCMFPLKARRHRVHRQPLSGRPGLIEHRNLLRNFLLHLPPVASLDIERRRGGKSSSPADGG